MAMQFLDVICQQVYTALFNMACTVEAINNGHKSQNSRKSEQRTTLGKP